MGNRRSVFIELLVSIGMLSACLFLFPNETYACKVLVDLNTFQKVDLDSVASLKCNGVWSILVNSDLADSDWSRVFRVLGPGWVVSEDNPGSNSDFLRVRRLAGYVDASMCYNETFVGPIVGATQGIGGTVLTASEIDQQAATHGDHLVVLTRSYETDGWSAAVDSALQNPKVSGVALECYPNRPPLYLDSLRVKELIEACLSRNKDFYFLSPGYTNYVADMKGYIAFLISEGVNFADNRIFLVAASYDYIAPFIGGDQSVEGVVKYYLSVEAEFANETNVDEMQQRGPDGFRLSQNFPNPFNPTTMIRYTIPEAGAVSLKVYDLLGEKVATLVDHEQQAGTHNVNFNATHLPSGIYFYRIEAEGFESTRKMMLLQ